MQHPREAYDVLVIGAGPGGYTAAIRAAQLGLSTTVVEREELGGVCLNRGCIPSKAMLRSAEVLDLARNAPAFGVTADNVRGNYAAVVERRDRIVAHMLQGVTNLLKGNGVDVIRGTATVADADSVAVQLIDGTTDIVYFRNLIVATGSSAARPPILGANLPGVIDSDGALALREAPRRAVVIGGGAVGVEWAAIWSAFDAEVTVLEMLPQLVPTEEPEIARELTRTFAKQGISVATGVQVREIRREGDHLAVVAAAGDEERITEADIVLLAVGRRPNVDGLNLEGIGVDLEPRRVPTDAYGRTNVPNIFAIGDATGRFLLAHVAAHQGIIAAATIAGQGDHAFDQRIVPAAIFTHPEIASVGLHEAEAAAQGVPVRIGRFPFAANGRAAAAGEAGGFVKIIAHQETGEVLGCHIVGPNAGDLIAEASLAMTLHATIDQLAATIHVHPTFSEAMLEAAFVAQGTPVHIPPRPIRREAAG
jgi:dihydrolipoamide dehydrogenase